jgi:hydrogenase maturation protease
MSATLAARPAPGWASPVRRGPAIAVEVLVCGSPDRGDDGAPIAAIRLLRARLPRDVALRVVGQLDVLDLLSIPPGAGVVIVDAATGIDPGAIVDLALNGLIGKGQPIRPRSSHALALPEVVGVAEMIRGRPLRGRIVAIGGTRFDFGKRFSGPVSGALRPLSDAVLEAIGQVRPPDEPRGDA